MVSGFMKLKLQNVRQTCSDEHTELCEIIYYKTQEVKEGKCRRPEIELAGVHTECTKCLPPSLLGLH